MRIFLLEAGSAATATDNPAANLFTQYGSLLLIVLMVVFFYFVLIRPQRKQEKQQNEMKRNLEVGDEVTTIGGIIGEIVSIKGETVTIETSKNRTKIRFLKDAIKSVDVKANGEIPGEVKETEKKSFFRKKIEAGETKDDNKAEESEK